MEPESTRLPVGRRYLSGTVFEGVVSKEVRDRSGTEDEMLIKDSVRDGSEAGSSFAGGGCEELSEEVVEVDAVAL